MTFLPIVERELRVNARRRSTYYSRLSTVGMALLILAWILVAASREAPARMGRILFTTLQWICFLFCLASGSHFTCDALSEEKREGTLGLLFLTDLKSWEILAGKLAARGLAAFYGLLAMAPVMCLPLLLGGITAGEVVRVLLVLLLTLTLSLCVGLASSAIATSSRASMSISGVLISGMTLGAPGVGALAAYLADRGTPSIFWLVVSPGFALISAADSLYSSESFGYWVSCSVMVVATVLALVTAAWVLPRAWQDRPREEGGGGSGWRHRLKRMLGAPTTRDEAGRARDLDLNPILWLAARHSMKQRLPWFFLGAVAVIWTWVGVKVGDEWFNEATYWLTTFVLFSVFKIWVASEAVDRFWQDRSTGALELILSTPLSVKSILDGQILSFQRQFLAPLMVTGVVAVIFMLAPLWSTLLSGPGNEFWTVMFAAGLAVFFMDVIGCFWAGLWTGLVTRRSNRAAGAVVGRVVVLPVAIYLAVLAGFVVLGVMGATLPSFENPQYWLLGGWFVLSLGNALFWALHSRAQLHDQLRSVAAARHESERMDRQA